MKLKQRSMPIMYVNMVAYTSVSSYMLLSILPLLQFPFSLILADEMQVCAIPILASQTETKKEEKK
jgi:type IV secretory pathway VirB3-like protein